MDRSSALIRKGAPNDIDSKIISPELVARLEEELGTEERDQIERLLKQINAALDSLEDEDVEADLPRAGWV
jgi:DNA-binding MarR family transcriptional regulator